jgi:hypothetical protein
MMRAQINQSRTDTALSEQQAIFTQMNTPALLAKVGREDPLSDEELIAYRRYFRAFNRNQDNNLWQYREGYLGENLPRSIQQAVRAVVGGSQLGLNTWERQKTGYTDEYIEFVEKAIQDLRN